MVQKHGSYSVQSLQYAFPLQIVSTILIIFMNHFRISILRSCEWRINDPFSVLFIEAVIHRQ